jgi:putative chitinase
MELAKKYKSLLNKYEINTPLRLAHFFAQIHHESNLKPIKENLNYSASGLIRIFRKYFTDLEAINFEKQPQRIANRVYANRMGNGDEKSDDGWRYCGRGFIQLTGKSNYESLSKDTGIDYTKNPDKLLTEADAMIAALWFWKKNNINTLADKDDVVGVTKKINGGKIGLPHRIELLSEYKKVEWDEVID